MSDLVEAISMETGISVDQALDVIHTVSSFVKEKFPLMSLTVDSVLGTSEHMAGVYFSGIKAIS